MGKASRAPTAIVALGRVAAVERASAIQRKTKVASESRSRRRRACDVLFVAMPVAILAFDCELCSVRSRFTAAIKFKKRSEVKRTDLTRRRGDAERSHALRVSAPPRETLL